MSEGLEASIVDNKQTLIRSPVQANLLSNTAAKFVRT